MSDPVEILAPPVAAGRDIIFDSRAYYNAVGFRVAHDSCREIHVPTDSVVVIDAHLANVRASPNSHDGIPRVAVQGDRELYR